MSQSTMRLPKFKDVAPGVLPDFQVEHDPHYQVSYFTPYTQNAKDWCARFLRMPMHGRSYMERFADGKPSEQALSLVRYLRKEGFAVSR